MNLADQPIFYIDLETTGLNPNKDYILEIAVAKSSLLNPYKYEHVYHAVLSMSQVGLKLADIDPFVFKMHTTNDLLLECYNSNKSVKQVESALWNIIVGPTLHEGAVKPILAGSACDFDKDFLEKWMPDIARVFSHRHLNVSSIKLFCESKGMEKLPKGEAHRAVKDIDETVDHLKKCDDWLKDFYTTPQANIGDSVLTFFPPTYFEGGATINNPTIQQPSNFNITLHTSEPLDNQSSEKLAEIIRLEVNKAINKVFEGRDWESESKARRLGEFVK